MDMKKTLTDIFILTSQPNSGKAGLILRKRVTFCNNSWANTHTWRHTKRPHGRPCFCGQSAASKQQQWGIQSVFSMQHDPLWSNSLLHPTAKHADCHFQGYKRWKIIPCVSAPSSAWLENKHQRLMLKCFCRWENRVSIGLELTF